MSTISFYFLFSLFFLFLNFSLMLHFFFFPFFSFPFSFYSLSTLSLSPPTARILHAESRMPDDIFSEQRRPPLSPRVGLRAPARATSSPGGLASPAQPRPCPGGRASRRQRHPRGPCGSRSGGHGAVAITRSGGLRSSGPLPRHHGRT